MAKSNEWGEFFPMKYSPFAYNETVAQEFFPMTKEEIISKGLDWKKKDQKEYQPQTYTGSYEIDEVSEAIIQEILACNDCKKNYKIIATEFDFYQKMHLPLPQKCHDCRANNRMSLRNPPKLWSRACAKCSTEIQTTYSPDRPEIIYCEKCYLGALY
jgi:hypothetical protein